MKAKCCGTCANWDVSGAKSKSGAVLNRQRLCKWEWPTMILPDSILRGAWRGEWRPPPPSYMGRDDGENCPCWEKRP